MTLSIEEQIERVADAAFEQTTPYRWEAPDAPREPSLDRPRRRSVVLTVAAVGLGLALIGGLVAVVDDRYEERPAGSSPSSSTPVSTANATTVPATTTPATPPTPPLQVVPFGSSVDEGLYMQVIEKNVEMPSVDAGSDELLRYQVDLTFAPEGRTSTIEQLSPTSTDGQLAIDVSCLVEGCLTLEPINDFAQTSLQLTIRRTDTPLTSGVHSSEFQVTFDDGSVLPFTINQLANPEPSDSIAEDVAEVNGRPAEAQTVVAEGGFAYHAISAFDSIWILDTSGGYVTRIDATSGAMLARIDVDARGSRLAASNDSVYVGAEPAVRIDPTANTASSITGGERTLGIISDGTTVWTGSHSGIIQRLDPDGTITSLDLPERPWMDLAFSTGKVWALSQQRGDSRLIAFDAATGELRHEIPIIMEGGGYPVRLVADDDAVVVGADATGRQTGELFIIDPATGAIVNDVDIESRPEGIVLTPQHIWTSGAVLDRHNLEILHEHSFGFTITRGPDGSIWGTRSVQGAPSRFIAVRTAPGNLAG